MGSRIPSSPPMSVVIYRYGIVATLNSPLRHLTVLLWLLKGAK